MNGTPPRRRVVFCTYPSIYSSLVLDRLLRAPAIDVVGVVLSTRIKGKGQFAPAAVIDILRHSGLAYAGYLLLASSLWRLAKPWHGLVDVSVVARQRQIALHHTADINAATSRQFIDDLAADVLLCAHFNQRLGGALLQSPDLLALNIHPSPLPAYRGFDPVLFAMLDQQSQLGVTLHVMDEAFDEGDVIETVAVPRDAGRSLLSNNLALFEVGVTLAVQRLSQGLPAKAGRPQSGGGHYVGWPQVADVGRLRRQGERLWRLADLRGSMRRG